MSKSEEVDIIIQKTNLKKKNLLEAIEMDYSSDSLYELSAYYYYSHIYLCMWVNMWMCAYACAYACV